MASHRNPLQYCAAHLLPRFVWDLECFYYTGKHDVLRQVMDFAIRVHWPHITGLARYQRRCYPLATAQPVWEWGRQVTAGWGRMVASWQANALFTVS